MAEKIPLKNARHPEAYRNAAPAPTPKQREEREVREVREGPEWTFLWDVIRSGCHTHHAVAGNIDACTKCDHDIRHPIHSPARVFEILNSLRTHSPEEPVGDMVALRDARFQVDAACAEMEGRKDHLMRSAEWFRRLRDCLDRALGQPLDGAPND